VVLVLVRDADFVILVVERHDVCMSLQATNRERVLFPLLRVCTLIHRETALIPYLENEFSFASFNGLAHFLQTLVPVQAAAIHAISVVESPFSGWSSWAGLSQILTVSYLDRRLPSLQSLALVIELKAHTIHPFNFYADKWAPNFCAFWHLPLAQVCIALHDVIGTANRHPRHCYPLPDQLSDWTKEIEGKLLQPYDKARKAEERKAKKRERDEQAENEAEARKQRRVSGGRLRAVGPER
jgi:hypothetical protein